MLSFNDISISVSCQQFLCTTYEFDEISSQMTLYFESTRKTSEVRCPVCGGYVYAQDNCSTTLKDAPVFSGIMQRLKVTYHRWQCTGCSHVFTEDLGLLKYPGTRITHRAAMVIKQLLRHRMTVSAVSSITGIRWNTICQIHRETMQEALQERQKELERKRYCPEYLAVDEFAIHKGHTYATCVMDLDTGDVIWAGMGRTIEAFGKFFEEIRPDTLSAVKAVAMDMNASYANVVKEHLPKAAIVYDRYHMQAQFGKDVLGSVRLMEAREHQQTANDLLLESKKEKDPARKKELEQQSKTERSAYTAVKRSRWTLLTNSRNLTEDAENALEQILQDHAMLATCYAMKEEMTALFEIRDPKLAKKKWKAWFKAAKNSGIPQLVKFAKLKEQRIQGLIAHAKFPISTGKLEGFNNKIKVAKRIGYGYRNNDYFFTLIKYLSIPGLRHSFHSFC